MITTTTAAVTKLADLRRRKAEAEADLALINGMIKALEDYVHPQLIKRLPVVTDGNLFD